MARYHEELLDAARLLIDRTARPRGRLPSARVRRSVSTAYYALFHFLLEEAARNLAGSPQSLQARRRYLMRTFTHRGVLSTMNRVKGRHVDSHAADFLRRGAEAGPVATPGFVRDMASAFIDAQAKRHDADYNMNSAVLAADATATIDRVSSAITGWQQADDSASRDFKHALSLLLLLKGTLRKDD